MGMSVASAGDRETFDFGWQFKYYGPESPEEYGSPAVADSQQSNHPAWYAVDGNMDTRWCAQNAKEGHQMMVRPGFKQPIKSVRLYWERPNDMELTLRWQLDGKKYEKVVAVGGKDMTEVPLDINRSLRELSIEFHKTDQKCWPGMREIVFIGKDDKIQKVNRLHKATDAARPDYKAAGYKPVQLPHDWAIESPFLADEPNETGKLPWNGFGWYRKNFDVPADFSAANDRYFLDFDGVMACPQVYVNGQKAGEWAYGYASFRVDITPFLKPGKNLVAVMASNKPLSTRWYPGAGIYRHVWLEKTAPTHLAHWGVYVTTPEITADAAKVKIETTVDNDSDAPKTVTVQQSVGETTAEAKTVEIAPKSSATVEQELVLTHPKLWSCENPNLYAVKTSVREGDKEIDAKETSFGVRTIEWKEDGFYLNGKLVPLNGVCEHHDLGALGSAFHARGYERKIEKLKEMGCNSIRMTHNPPAPEVLELCDRMGMLVIDELFDIWQHQKYDKVNGYHVFWPQWWKKDVKNFVMRDRNHPCIIAWSGGNEIIEIVTEDGIDISNNLRAEMKKYDTTRPYTVGTNAVAGMKNGFADTEDVFGFNYKPHSYGKFHELHPGKPLYGSETASGVSTRDTYFFPMTWRMKNTDTRNYQVNSYGTAAVGWGNIADIDFAAQKRDGRVAGQYVWTGFDYIGEPTPYNQDKTNENNEIVGMSAEEKKAYMAMMEKMGNKAPSRSSYFGLIDLAGFPKDNFYLYQSEWRPDFKHAHILPHWNWAGREGEVTPVVVYTSGDEAELFVNGKSQGVRRRGEGETFKQNQIEVGKNDYRFVWEEVKYEPGKLEVRVKKNGEPWTTAARVTTGKTVKVGAELDRQAIVGDARDLCHIELALKDKDGNVVPTDSRDVEFSISGPAQLVGFCNGNPVDQTCMKDTKQKFFNGRILAIVRGKRGKSGKATVTVKAQGLPELKLDVDVTKATPEQLRK